MEGIYSKGKYRAKIAGKATPEYDMWSNMLKRCYDDTVQNKRPTYKGCTVHESFKNFQKFMEWAEKQIGFGVHGYQLDKDILSGGNLIYSPEICVFIPSALNNLVISCNARRGTLPIGVYKCDQKFKAAVRIDGKYTHLGVHDTAEDAFNAYKIAKEQNIKRLANIYRDSIDGRVYNTLMEYTVDIND